ncbi:MAG: hypothetical protein R3181_15105, partial [Rubricoccaceae bacterium]|nr:hypothetical protein [Rubricoccaceae bacterium]
MSTSDPPSPTDRPEEGGAAENGFNPFRLLDVETLEGPTLDRYAVYLVGLRRTLRDGLKRAGPQEA